MRTTKLMRFVRIERGVNPSEHDISAAPACDLPDFIAAQRIGRVDADAHNVARLNLVRVCRDKGLVQASPKIRGVAAASTYNQRGVMTAVPKETSLGLMR